MIPLEIEILIGLATGLVVGITGASGVLLVVPLLTILLNFSMHTAVGTSLFVDVITPLVVAYSYYRHGNVNLKSALWLAIGAILGAQAGALVANSFVPSELMSKGFILFMIGMAVSMWIKSYRPKRENARVRLSEMNHKNRLITFGIGLLLGICSGLFGAGGGLMFLLVLIVILKYPHSPGNRNLLTDHGHDGCVRYGRLCHPGQCGFQDRHHHRIGCRGQRSGRCSDSQ